MALEGDNRPGDRDDDDGDGDGSGPLLVLVLVLVRQMLAMMSYRRPCIPYQLVKVVRLVVLLET